MGPRVITALLALLSSFLSIYSLSYHSLMLHSAFFLRRRQRLAHLTLLSTTIRRQRRPRRFWIRPRRTQVWWLNFVRDNVLPVEWKENFRMQRHNFQKLCTELAPLIEKKETNMRKPNHSRMSNCRNFVLPF